MTKPYCHMARAALERLNNKQLVEIKNAPRFYDESRNDAAAILERRGHYKQREKLEKLAAMTRSYSQP